MGTSLSDTLVTVYPFAHRVDGDEAIIANPTRTSFLAIPAPALDILTDLAAGRTVGQARNAFAEKHGETPDMDDFLAMLADEGFVVLAAPTPLPAPPAAEDSQLEPSARLPRYHFEGISELTARRIFSWPVLGGCCLIIALALLAVAVDPSILPPPSVLVFTHDLTPLTLVVTAFVLLTVFLHELAHLIAARAAGVPARLGVSNRLWYLVAETDMTGVWLASRRERYLAFLAGPLLDATSAAALILALWANDRWPWLPQLAATLGEAFLFTYGLRLLWQCFFFLRTDFYYVIATYFNCKNLLGDTEAWLVSKVARPRRGSSVEDRSAIPVEEQRVIRAYAVVWLLGRVVAIASLVWFTLPILRGYALVLNALFFGARPSNGTLLDGLIWSGLTLATQGGGMYLWLRSVYRSRSLARRQIA